MASHLDDNAFCERLLEVGDQPVDVQKAYERFHAQHLARRPSRAPFWLGAGLAAVAALVIGIELTPLGGIAQNIMAIFQPKQFVAIDVSGLTSEKDRGLLPQLQSFGSFQHPKESKAQKAPSLSAAEAAVGYRVLTPSEVPADVPHTVHYLLMPTRSQAFTFSAKKARATVEKGGHRLPPVPAHLDGTTVSVSFGPGVIQVWGSLHRDATSRTEQKSAADMPSLVVAQARTPKVFSTGASLNELEQYLLSLPGISPQLASRIRAIGDPSTTMPIPVRLDKQTAQQVTIDGVTGLAIGDNTGVGSGVIWQKDGMIHAVGGALPESVVVDIASKLH